MQPRLGVERREEGRGREGLNGISLWVQVVEVISLSAPADNFHFLVSVKSSEEDLCQRVVCCSESSTMGATPRFPLAF